MCYTNEDVGYLNFILSFAGKLIFISYFYFYSDNHSKIPTKFSLNFFYIFVFNFQPQRERERKKRRPININQDQELKLRIVESDHEKLASYIWGKKARNSVLLICLV